MIYAARLTAIAALALCGCAAKVTSSSPRTVVITGPTGAIAEAQQLANVECAKHGRYARMIEKAGPRSAEFVFDCVL